MEVVAIIIVVWIFIALTGDGVEGGYTKKYG